MNGNADTADLQRRRKKNPWPRIAGEREPSELFADRFCDGDERYNSRRRISILPYILPSLKPGPHDDINSRKSYYRDNTVIVTIMR